MIRIKLEVVERGNELFLRVIANFQDKNLVEEYKIYEKKTDVVSEGFKQFLATKELDAHLKEIKEKLGASKDTPVLIVS